MFEVLRTFGKSLFNYYLNLYTEDEIFFLIVNREILEECCQKTGITISELEQNLQIPETYKSDDPYVYISIAAYQVYLFSEVRRTDSADSAYSTLETKLIDFYKTNDVATLYRIFNQENRNWQRNVWAIVQDYFIKKRRYLVIDNSRHSNHIYLKYPETQLDFLVTAKYDLDLICRKFNLTSESSYKNVEETATKQFKRILNSSRNIKRSASSNQREITQTNLLKSISLFTFVYSRRNINNNKLPSIGSVTVQANNYEYAFEYDSYSDEYRLCVLEKGLYVFSSDEDEEKKWQLLSEQLEGDSTDDVVCGVFEKDEYGFAYTEAPDDSVLKNEFIFISRSALGELINFSVSVASKAYHVYKIQADAENRDRIISLVKEKIYGVPETDEGVVIDASFASKFLGGIKIGKNWLLGCEPKVPKNCSKLVFDTEKGKTYYPLIDKRIIPITIIDRNNPDQIIVEETNIGWHIYNNETAKFPDGYDVKSPAEKETKETQNEVKQEPVFKGKPFKNDRFIGEFIGNTIAVKKSYIPAQNVPVAVEDNYIFKDFEKKMLKEIRIIPDKQLCIGDEVTFRIKANADNTLFQAIIEDESIKNRKIYEGFFDGKKVVVTSGNNDYPDRIIRPEIVLPVGTVFKFSLRYDSEGTDNLLAIINPESIKKPYNEKAFKLLGYKKYIENRNIQAAWFDTFEGFPANFCINMPMRKIERSAVHFGAYCISVSAENNLSENKRLQTFIQKAKEDSASQYFIVIKYESQINKLMNILVLPADIYANNIKVFFVKKEAASTAALELENEDLECQFSENKDKELAKKQQQLLWWIEYEGFVTWEVIRKKCNMLIKADEDAVREDYEKYGSIYQIFYPLVISGKVEVCTKNIESTAVFGFCISKKWLANEASQDELNKQADFILDEFPTVCSVIQGWNNSYNIYSDSEVYSILNTRNGYAFAQNPGRIDKLVEQYNSIIFKTKPEIAPYIPRNIAWKDTESDFIIMKEIPIKNYCDANFYVNCFIECKKGQSIFEYSKATNELKCNKALPVLIQRALLMYDKERLIDMTGISGSKWKFPYRNISPETIKRLNRIFGITIKEV